MPYRLNFLNQKFTLDRPIAFYKKVVAKIRTNALYLFIARYKIWIVAFLSFFLGCVITTGILLTVYYFFHGDTALYIIKIIKFIYNLIFKLKIN